MMFLPIVLLAILSGCASQPPAVFQHDVADGPRPWKSEAFDANEDRFTFAVFSDLNSQERPQVFEIAVAQLALLRPELIMNVGDLTPGGSDDPAVLQKQWDSFDQRASKASAPIFYVGGNHDLELASSQQVWTARNGPAYYSFVYKNVLFLVLNTQDAPAPSPARAAELARLREEGAKVFQSKGLAAGLDTEYANAPEQLGGGISPEQSAYFLKVIADHPNVRWTFLFMHKAPWKVPGEKNFAAVEAALANRPYTVFHGHEHNYQYLERNGRDYIQLATTGGGQPPNFRVSKLTGETQGRAMDQVALVTVGASGVDVANLKLSGILDKTGHVPQNGDDVCFDACGDVRRP